MIPTCIATLAAAGLLLAPLTAAEDTPPTPAPNPVEEQIRAKGPAAADEAKHASRLATLDRLEALAKEKNNTKLLEQVAHMRAQEAERHERVRAAHSAGKRPDHAGKPADTGKPEHPGTSPDKNKPDRSDKPADAGKPADTGKPDDAGKPAGKGKPEHAGKPTAP